MKKLRVKRFLLVLAAFLTIIVGNAQRIVVLNDVHVTPGNDNDYALEKAIQEINSADYDCVVVNGDLTNQGSDVELEHMHHMLSNITHPLYVVPGNHEDTWSQSATQTFSDLWGYDRFAAKIGNLVIAGINCGPYMKMGDGHIKQEDMHWLKETLDTMVNDGDNVISFNHYPIRKDDLDNYYEYISLLEQYPVIAHINGHYHTYDLYKAGDIDAVMTRALFINDSYGYSIVEITNDSVEVWEKLIDTAPTLKYKFPIKTDHPITPQIETPKLSILPTGFKVSCMHADSASIFTRLAFDENHVYFGTSTGYAKALNKGTGDISWQRPLGASLFARPTVLADGQVAIPSSKGIILLDAHNGETIKTISAPPTSCVADGINLEDSLYIQGCYGRIEARKASDGEIIWTYDSIENYCQASPTVYGNDLVFGAWDTYLRCLDMATGSLKWKWSNGKNNNLYSPGNVVPVVNEKYVIIVSPDRFMTALDRSTGETIWRDNSHKYRESLGQSEDGKVAYAKTMDGELVAVDAHSQEFKELWICDMQIGYDHAPCIVAEKDGIIYAGSRRGILTGVSKDTHQVVLQLTLGCSEINGIDIDPHDGSIWVSLIEGKIYRVAPTPI